MMEQVQRQTLPIFMQERMAALESAGYAVQETCRDSDHFTAGGMVSLTYSSSVAAGVH